MTCQGFQTPLFSYSHKHLISHISTRLPPKVGLLTLLLLSSGAIASPTQAEVNSSTPIAQVSDTATVIYVNPTLGTDESGRGRGELTPYRTITYALSQAQQNTVIQLAPGSYTRDTGEVFPLVTKPGVIIRGDESTKGQTVVIIGGENYVSPTFARQSVTIRTEGNSQIRGVTVTNPYSRGTGIWVEAGNPTIRNSTFANSLRDGVFVSGNSTPTIEGNVFTNNDGNGISLARAAQGEIRNNVFQDTGFGLAIGGTASPLVANNQIIQNTDGVVVSNSARPVLRGNVIENNTRDGVVAIADALPDLGTTDNPGENIIRSNARHDVYNATRSNTLVAVGNQIDPQRISGLVNFVAADVASSSFRDVQGHWAQAYIESLATKQIISGFPDGTYRPNDPVTRAQFAAIVNKAFAPAPQRPATAFRDVTNSFWGYQAIQTAYRGGFLSGYPGGIFEPNQRIPRVQVLVALSSGLGLSSSDTAFLSRYQDSAQIPSYAASAVAGATQRQIVVNYPTVNQLSPNREATRAEVAAFVYQALVSAGQAEAIPSPYLVLNP